MATAYKNTSPLVGVRFVENGYVTQMRQNIAEKLEKRGEIEYIKSSKAAEAVTERTPVVKKAAEKKE